MGSRGRSHYTGHRSYKSPERPNTRPPYPQRREDMRSYDSTRREELWHTPSVRVGHVDGMDRREDTPSRDTSEYSEERENYEEESGEYHYGEESDDQVEGRSDEGHYVPSENDTMGEADCSNESDGFDIEGEENIDLQSLGTESSGSEDPVEQEVFRVDHVRRDTDDSLH